MISVGIDVSKEKSTVCILKPYGELVSRPFEVKHLETELDSLDSFGDSAKYVSFISADKTGKKTDGSIASGIMTFPMSCNAEPFVI